jgi:hypothetical protein
VTTFELDVVAGLADVGVAAAATAGVDVSSEPLADVAVPARTVEAVPALDAVGAARAAMAPSWAVAAVGAAVPEDAAALEIASEPAEAAAPAAAPKIEPAPRAILSVAVPPPAVVPVRTMGPPAAPDAVTTSGDERSSSNAIQSAPVVGLANAISAAPATSTPPETSACSDPWVAVAWTSGFDSSTDTSIVPAGSTNAEPPLETSTPAARSTPTAAPTSSTGACVPGVEASASSCTPGMLNATAFRTHPGPSAHVEPLPCGEVMRTKTSRLPSELA